MQSNQTPPRFCQNCGQPVDPNAYVCIHCGARLAGTQPPPPPPPPPQPDIPHVGYTILGFFFPLIGLILYLVWMNDRPQMAKCAGKGAIIGVCVSVGGGLLLGILYAVLMVIIMGIAAAGAAAGSLALLPLLI